MVKTYVLVSLGTLKRGRFKIPITLIGQAVALRCIISKLCVNSNDLFNDNNI